MQRFDCLQIPSRRRLGNSLCILSASERKAGLQIDNANCVQLTQEMLKPQLRKQLIDLLRSRKREVYLKSSIGAQNQSYLNRHWLFIVCQGDFFPTSLSNFQMDLLQRKLLTTILSNFNAY